MTTLRIGFVRIVGDPPGAKTVSSESNMAKWVSIA